MLKEPQNYFLISSLLAFLNSQIARCYQRCRGKSIPLEVQEVGKKKLICVPASHHSSLRKLALDGRRSTFGQKLLTPRPTCGSRSMYYAQLSSVHPPSWQCCRNCVFLGPAALVPFATWSRSLKHTYVRRMESGDGREAGEVCQLTYVCIYEFIWDSLTQKK